MNTDYFEEMGEQLGIGGYEYAKLFFEEAYKQAVQEAGGEDYILSAVLHADEKNVAATEKYGRDTYHYHLHVVFIPVVEKEVKWTKRCKDPALVGTVKEVIKQVSSSKKWLSEMVEDENGNKTLEKSYSKLQDRFHDHMKEAGFTGFERGEKGSTAEHLDVLDFKIKQDKARAEALAAEVAEQQSVADDLSVVAKELTTVVEDKHSAVAELDTVISNKQQATAILDEAIGKKEQKSAQLDEKTEKKNKQLETLDKRTAVKQAEVATIAEIDAMTKSSVLSANLQISPADWKKVSTLAKEGVKAKGIIADLKAQVSKLLEQLGWYKKRNEQYEGKGVSEQMKYFEALQRAPKRLAEVVADILRKPAEQQQQKSLSQTKKQGIDR